MKENQPGNPKWNTNFMTNDDTPITAPAGHYDGTPLPATDHASWYQPIITTKLNSATRTVPSLKLPNPSTDAAYPASTTMQPIFTSAPATTKAPTPIATSDAPQSKPSSASAPNLSSQVCIDCTNALGASNCAASDNTYLIKQCQTDTNGQQCGINCNQYSKR